MLPENWLQRVENNRLDLLFQDREKERVKRESEEAKRREAEEAEAAVRSAQERQEKIRQAKIDLAARVQPEPDASGEDVTRILIKVNPNCKKEERSAKQLASVIIIACICYFEVALEEAQKLTGWRNEKL